MFRIIEQVGYSVVAQLSWRAEEGVTFSLGYLSMRLNCFHRHLLEKQHSSLMVN